MTANTNSGKMHRLLTHLAVLFVLLIPAGAQDLESLLTTAQEKMEAGDYAGAVVVLAKAQELVPDDPEVLFNLGMAANMTGDYARGIKAFSRFHELEPEEPRGLTKLIQAYQGAGQDAEAETLIDELRGMWKAGKLVGLPMDEERSFVREQFTVGKYLVMAFEFFEPDPAQREHTWDFCVLENGQDQVGMYYVMRDDAASAQITAESGEVPYYFDVRWKGGGGTLVGMTERKPTYAQAAAIIKRALAGEKVGPLIELP